MNQCHQRLNAQLQQTLNLLESVGFLVNKSKSDLSPSKKMQFLVESFSVSLSLPSRKLSNSRNKQRRTIAKPTISLCHMARVVGHLLSSIQAIFQGPFYYRALPHLKCSHLHRGLTYSQFVHLSEEASTELQWWISHM